MATAAPASRSVLSAGGSHGVAERALRRLSDARMAVAGLLAVGALNLLAALVPEGRTWLDGAPYAAALAVVALTSVAAVAVRAPATWREWRRPGPVAHGGRALVAVVDPCALDAEAVATSIGALGYRARVERRRGRWAVHGVRRGWARFAGQAAHLSLVGLLLGATAGHALGAETTFSLLPGDQALLDAPRPDVSSAVRLESLDAAFGADGRPERLDVTVTYLRDGAVAGTEVVRVNEPGAFDGYALHAWTYGPAARLRVTTLGGAPLADDAIPLDAVADGRPAGTLALPSVDATLGLVLDTDNRLAVSGLTAGRDAVATVLRPGEEQRIGDLVVGLSGFDAWVTFLSRSDPGAPVLVGSAAVLSASLAVGLWLPRRRVSVRPHRDGLRVVLRGERFDAPSDELDRLVRGLGAGR